MKLPVWIADPLRTLLGVEQDARLLMARDEHLRQQVSYLADWLTGVDEALYQQGRLLQSMVAKPELTPDIAGAADSQPANSTADVEARAAEIREQVSKMKREFPIALKELQDGNVLRSPGRDKS